MRRSSDRSAILGSRSDLPGRSAPGHHGSGCLLHDGGRLPCSASWPRYSGIWRKTRYEARAPPTTAFSECIPCGSAPSPLTRWAAGWPRGEATVGLSLGPHATRAGHGLATMPGQETTFAYSLAPRRFERGRGELRRVGHDVGRGLGDSSCALFRTSPGRSVA